MINQNKSSNETLKFMIDTICSPSNISSKTALDSITFSRMIVGFNITLKEQYITFLMDVIDSKSKISYAIYNSAKSYLASIFAETLSTEVTVECIVQRLKRSSYNSFGAILAVNGILCNQNKYACGEIFDLSKSDKDKDDMKLGNVLIKKYDLLDEFVAAGNMLCEKAVSNEFNGDNLPEFYETLFFVIYKLSVLKKEFDLGLFGQIMNQFKMFADDSNLLALTANLLSKIIDM